MVDGGLKIGGGQCDEWEGNWREKGVPALPGHLTALSPQGQYCDICTAANSNRAHPVSNAIDGTERWWQSPPLSRGLEYNEVNVTLDLGQVECHLLPLFRALGFRVGLGPGGEVPPTLSGLWQRGVWARTEAWQRAPHTLGRTGKAGAGPWEVRCCAPQADAPRGALAAPSEEFLRGEPGSGCRVWEGPQECAGGPGSGHSWDTCAAKATEGQARGRRGMPSPPAGVSQGQRSPLGGPGLGQTRSPCDCPCDCPDAGLGVLAREMVRQSWCLLGWVGAGE